MAYKEKRYGKKELKILASVVLAIAVASILVGIALTAVLNHWVKFIILGVTLVLGLGLLLFGIYIFIIISSTHDEGQSVRDGNESKGIANATICDKCGRVVGENDEHCAHCGTELARAEKNCVKCGAKNDFHAEHCTKCGEKLD